MANQRNESTQRDPANGRDKNAIGNMGSSDMSDGIDKAKDTGKTLLDQAKSTAGDAYESVTEKATTTLEEKKAGLTGGLKSVADSIRQVGDKLNKTPDRTPVADYSARYAQTAAQKLEGIAHYFETKDLKSVGKDVEMYARRNPAIFLGGAFVLGLLAARFLKSSPTPSISHGVAAPDHQLTPGTGFEAEQGRGTAPGTI